MEFETRFVFVDTSMYQQKNFQFHLYALGRFKELCEEESLYLLMNKVVESEVKKHLIQKAHEAANHIKEFKSTIKILRNLPELPHHGIFEELPKSNVESMLLEKFDNFIEYAVHEYVDLDLASTSKIVDSYFNFKPPFSQSKPNEFPDAIMLEALLSWSKSKSNKVYVLSTDGDMKNFCASHPNQLEYIDDLDSFINMVVTNEDKLSDITSFSKSQLDLEMDNVIEMLDEQINSIEYSTLGYDIDDEVNNTEAFDLKIKDVNIIKADKNYSEFSLSISFTVDAWHNLTDYDRSIWDSEDKVYMFTAQTSRKVRHQVFCKAYVWLNHEDGLPANVDIQDAYIEDSYLELDPDDGEIIKSVEHEIFAS